MGHFEVQTLKWPKTKGKNILAILKFECISSHVTLSLSQQFWAILRYTSYVYNMVIQVILTVCRKSKSAVELKLIHLSPIQHQFKKYKPRASMKSHVVETQTNDSIKKGSFFLQPRAHAHFGFNCNGSAIPKNVQFRVAVQIEGIYKNVENCQVHRETVFR